MTEQHQTNKNVKTALIFLITIIVFAIITSAGYWGFNLITDKINTATDKVAETITATKQLQIKYDQLQNNLQELQKDLQKANISKVKYWLPLVVEHLVYLADLTLNTTKDTKLALTFLEKAKQYTNDPELSAINHALNKDIANLQMVPIINESELILKIEAINQKMVSLHLTTAQFTTSQKNQETTQEAIEVKSLRIKTLWQRFFTSTINALKDIVIIRHKKADLLLSPDQETIVRLQIQAKLLQAQLAVMHRQNIIYHSCLTQTINLINQYFATNQNTTTDILPLLQELQQVDLEPKISFTMESIAAITNFININKLPSEQPPSPITLPKEEKKGTDLP